MWAPHGQELFFQGYRDSDGLRAMMVADVSWNRNSRSGMSGGFSQAIMELPCRCATTT